MTLLGGACRFDDALDPSQICARIDSEQGIDGRYGRSCAGAFFSATLGTGTSLRGSASLMIAADIRLDNRGEITDALGVVSVGTDADLLLSAWNRLGAASLNLIVGDFAFAVFDGSQHKLTLVRDSAGQRPYTIATELMALRSRRCRTPCDRSEAPLPTCRHWPINCSISTALACRPFSWIATALGSARLSKSTPPDAERPTGGLRAPTATISTATSQIRSKPIALCSMTPCAAG